MACRDPGRMVPQTRTSGVLPPAPSGLSRRAGPSPPSPTPSLRVRRGRDPVLHPVIHLLLRPKGDPPGVVGHRELVGVAAHLGVDVALVERIHLVTGGRRVPRGHGSLLCKRVLPIRPFIPAKFYTTHLPLPPPS